MRFPRSQEECVARLREDHLTAYCKLTSEWKSLLELDEPFATMEFLCDDNVHGLAEVYRWRQTNFRKEAFAQTVFYRLRTPNGLAETISYEPPPRGP